MNRTLRVQRSTLAKAAVACLMWACGPASADIVSLGVVSPDPTTGTVSGFLGIGQNGTGSVTVNGGSLLTTDNLGLSNPIGASNIGNGTLTVTGAGSRVVVLAPTQSNLDIGGLGTGSVSLLAGGMLSYGSNSAACQTGCSIKVSESAGSTGNLLVSGTGSALSTVASVVVGQNLLWRASSGDAFDYGSVGGHAQGTARVQAGATINSSTLIVATFGSGNALTANERASGSVLVDGIGSVWNVVRNAAQTGGRSLLSIASSQSTTGTVEVRNGGVIRLDGSSAAGEFSGIGVSSPGSTSTATQLNGTLTVDGAGSRIELVGGRGFFNIGRSAGATATVNITNGGQITGGNGETGLQYTNVGRAGATGTLNISGAGSLLQLNGKQSDTNIDPTAVFGGGPSMTVGATDSVQAGHGSVNISGGARLRIDSLGQVLTNPNGLTGLTLGRGAGSVGTMAIAGAGSVVEIAADSGLAPSISVGRDGSSGQLSITGGGKLLVNSTHTSVPNLGTTVYLPGDLTLLDIGRRGAGSDGLQSSGSVTVSGAGSELVLAGSVDSLLSVGRGAAAQGLLTVSDGAAVRANLLIVGTGSGSAGTVNVNGGQLMFGGTLNGGPGAGQGGGVSVGREGGLGVLNLSGGTTLTIAGTAPNAGLTAASSTVFAGGTGLINISGGSTVLISGPSAQVGIGRTSAAGVAGTGVMTLSGAGSSVSVSGSNAQVLIGGMANTSGTVVVGAGSSVSAVGGTVGVAHDSSGSTAGSGTLIVNGTVSAANLNIGALGYVGGAGTINANVMNLGVFNPGNSPGRLTVNGDFDNSGGKIVLEVQSLGGGQFAVDELVFSDWSRVLLGAGSIEFAFVGDTDPTEFRDAGLFSPSTFFKQFDGNGDVVNVDDSQLGLFTDSQFSASAESFVISSFVFSPTRGASFSATAIPLPASLPLVLVALAMLGVTAQRRRS